MGRAKDLCPQQGDVLDTSPKVRLHKSCPNHCVFNMNEKRNWKIYYEWIDGKQYAELANEFGLAKSTIKQICTSKVPDKVKQTSWQTDDSYRKWREFVSTERHNTKLALGDQSDSGSTPHPTERI